MTASVTAAIKWTGGVAAGVMALLVAPFPQSPGVGAPTCAPNNGEITLPQGFCAMVVADQVGSPRHLVVAPNGDVFVALEDRRGGPGGVLALRDTTGDGKPDVNAHFGNAGGSGIALGKGALYFGTQSTVLRYPMATGRLTPAAAPQVIVRGLPTGGHSAKTLALSADGRWLFVNIGSQSNSCQERDRSLESPGRNPCVELETRAGIWRFDANRTNQGQADGQRYATGIRNAVGFGFDPAGQLWATQHGRDQLAQNWGKLFTVEQSAEKPSEELLRVDQGDDFGWPYCYHDPGLGHRVLAPEYGGDGKQVGLCGQKEEPALAFPAHWAPNGVVFYSGSQFPAAYRGGAFITFHGSWNRAPLPQQGYRVVFAPFRDGKPAGRYETFADGFWREDAGLRRRPVGVAQGPDGSLYITDDAAGRIWRVMYKGGEPR